MEFSKAKHFSVRPSTTLSFWKFYYWKFYVIVEKTKNFLPCFKIEHINLALVGRIQTPESVENFKSNKITSSRLNAKENFITIQNITLDKNITVKVNNLNGLFFISFVRKLIYAVLLKNHKKNFCLLTGTKYNCRK